MMFHDFKDRFEKEIQDDFNLRLDSAVTYINSKSRSMSLKRINELLEVNRSKLAKSNARKGTMLENLLGSDNSYIYEARVDRFEFLKFLMERMRWNTIGRDRLYLLLRNIDNYYPAIFKEEYTDSYIEKIGGSIEKKTASEKVNQHKKIADSTSSYLIKSENEAQTEKYSEIVNFMNEMCIEVLDYHYLNVSETPADFRDYYEGAYPNYYIQDNQKEI